MKHLLILIIGFCLLLTSVPAGADQAADEAAIKKAYKEYVSLLDARDTRAIAALHDDTYEHWKGIYKGKKGAEKSHEDRFRGQKDTRMRVVEEIGLIFVNPDVAIYKYRGETTGLVGRDGNQLPPAKYLSAIVYVKRDGQWLIAATFGRDVEE